MKCSFYSIFPGRVQQKVNNLEEIVGYNEQFSLVSIYGRIITSSPISKNVIDSRQSTSVFERFKTTIGSTGNSAAEN